MYNRKLLLNNCMLFKDNRSFSKSHYCALQLKICDKSS